MNGFVIFCQLVLIYVSYSPYVRGHQPGQVYDLKIAKKNTYNELDPEFLESSETFTTSETNKVHLRYDGDSSYTVFSDGGQIEFTVKRIFVLARDLVGVMTDNPDENIHLRFANESDAKDMCESPRDFGGYSANDFQVYTVLAMNNPMSQQSMQVTEILRNGAVNVVHVGPKHCRFAIHPSDDFPIPPIALFTSNSVGFGRGPKPNQLIMEYQIGHGAFYFGLIFPSNRITIDFVQFLNGIGMLKHMTQSDLTTAITTQMFANY